MYVASVVLAVCSYVTIISKAVVGTEGLSLSTFSLWALLAAIIGLAQKDDATDPALAMVYGIGASITALVLFVKGQCVWTPLDTTVSILVFVCLVLWKTLGSKWAMTLAILSGVIASVPYVMLTWKFPQSSPYVANIMFLVANTLAFMSVDDWAITKVLYPGVNVLMGIIMLVPLFF